jgi:hypothetical protein
MKTKWKIGIATAVVSVLLIVLFTEGVLIPKQLQPNVLPIRLLSVSRTETAEWLFMNSETKAVPKSMYGLLQA